ncbi:hypothetical protein K1T71_007211 [Dendrolimus kikuchii]|uniref:Uncharacterized protein n=1 Tax=Dendrolimus kikuchii TaxID=765133 RepID=A0ACC1D1E1_9NEOP|nr:hypothetical protein K1T71_007211 [Dendrolimus kikuchii]
MSIIIKFDLKELRNLANDKNSCIVEKKVTQNLALQPWCLGSVKESIRNLLDYKIGKFDKELNGILLSYKNFRLLQNVGTIRNDNADINFQVQADYFIFQPYVGATLTGIVNKKSITHLGILVHRVFNVVIPRPTEEPGNNWIGTNIQEGQQVKFRIVVLDLYGALPYIRGELDESSIKLGPDGDDEEIETRLVQPLNVSYVDFTKTRPQTQIGDTLQHATNSLRSPGNKHSVTPVIEKGHVTNGKSHTKKTKIVASEMSIIEKGNTKRQIKIDNDSKQPEIKLLKKHKRNV